MKKGNKEMIFSKKFICASAEYATYTKRVPAPAFRRSFTLSGAKSATLTVCGLGFYELYVNGKRITRGRLSPYIANPDDVLYYDSYDILPYLSDGENVIGVMLGNGVLNSIGGQIWKFDEAPFRSAPKFALCFEAERDGGERIVFDASEGFLWARTPIIFDDLRIGEFYDARAELGAWSSVGYDANEWKAPISAEAPHGICRLCDVPPIVKTYELKPCSVHRGKITHLPNVDERLPKLPYPEGEENREGYIYDFGVNAAGVVRLNIKGAKCGQKIVLQFAEKLAEDGGIDLRSSFYLPIALNHRDIYICRGGDEVYTPTFTYHGFRYCLVTGIDESQAIEELLTYEVMNTDLALRSHFRCSDEVANRIWDAAIVSDLANFYHIPTDCPQREKNGWTGDMSLSAEQMMMALTAQKSLSEWLFDLRLTMHEDGTLPGIVPTNNWGYCHGPAWDNVIVTLPYYIWLYSGDKDVLRDNADAMLRYLKYMITRIREDSLVDYGLGDWCEIESAYPVRTPGVVSGTFTCIDYCAKAEKIFSLLEMADAAELAHTAYERLRNAARAELIDTDACEVKCRSQTGQAMAIYYNVFDECEKAGAAERLVEIINADGGSVTCGILGMRVLFHVLSDYGYTSLAYKMITKPSFPSYGYMIACGATALWEKIHRFEEQSPSLNHHFFGDVISWFMKNLVGIRVNPNECDVNEILVAPKLIPELSYAKGDYTAPNGRVEIEWKRNGGEALLRYSIADGVHARLSLSDTYLTEQGSNEMPLAGTGELKLINKQA